MLTESERQFVDEFYRTYGRMLFVYSFSLLRPLPDAVQAAEECVQETFERAMLKIRQVMRHEAPIFWLKNTCRKVTLAKKRKLLNRQRIAGRTVPIDADHDIAEPKDCIEIWILENDLFDVKQDLLGALTEEEAAVYQLFYEKGLPIKAAAETLQITDGAVQAALRRIRAKLERIASEFVDSP